MIKGKSVLFYKLFFLNLALSNGSFAKNSNEQAAFVQSEANSSELKQEIINQIKIETEKTKHRFTAANKCNSRKGSLTKKRGMPEMGLGSPSPYKNDMYRYSRPIH